MRHTKSDFVDGRIVPRISEKEFQAQVVELARMCGWEVYHTHDSRHSDAGFPDLVLAHGVWQGPRMIVAELKVGGKVPTPEQYAWLARFEAAGIKAYFWRPEMWPDIEAVLKGEP